jgi:hypothetical protein
VRLQRCTRGQREAAGTPYRQNWQYMLKSVCVKNRPQRGRQSVSEMAAYNREAARRGQRRGTRRRGRNTWTTGDDGRRENCAEPKAKNHNRATQATGNRTAQRGRECHTIELTEQLHRRPAGGKIPSCVTSTALERLSYAEMRATKRHR